MPDRRGGAHHGCGDGDPRTYTPAVLLTINGESRDVPATVSTLADLVHFLGLGARPRSGGCAPCAPSALANAFAVEVNGTLAPRRRFHEHGLAEGDRVEIVTLVGGG